MLRYDLTQLSHHIAQFEILSKPQYIMEVGSRDGRDAAFLSEYWNIPHKQCIVIDANPVACERITADYPDMMVYNCGLGAVSQILPFNEITADNTGESSFLDRGWSVPVTSSVISVNCYTYSDFIRDIGLCGKPVDLIKVDVEGYGYEFASGISDSDAKNIKFIQMELEHIPYWKNQRLINDVIALMKSKGFALISHIKNLAYQSENLFINRNVSGMTIRD